MTGKEWLDGPGGRSIEQLIELEDSCRIDSIVVAIEESLMAKADMTPSEEIVLAVEAMEREVNNGGFEQFFLNSSYEYAPILVAALQKIGASQTASIANRAMRVLGAGADWSPERYEEVTSEADETVLEELRACDDAYYAAGEAIAEKLFGFIKANQADIVV